MNDSSPRFAAHCARVADHYARAGSDRTDPGIPFCIDGGNGTRLTAMQQVRCTLSGFLAIVLGVTTAITAIFTVGIVLMVLAALTIAATLYWLVVSSRWRRLGRSWQDEARAWPATVVMAHHSVHEPGNSIVPGAMLVDFGPNPDAERMEEAAEAVFALAQNDSVPASHLALRDWLRTEMQRARFGRIRVPRDLAGNDTTFVVSLRFDRAMMPAGHVDRRHFFVKARADRDESAEILPHRYWTQTG